MLKGLSLKSFSKYLCMCIYKNIGSFNIKAYKIYMFKCLKKQTRTNKRYLSGMNMYVEFTHLEMPLFDYEFKLFLFDSLNFDEH